MKIIFTIKLEVYCNKCGSLMNYHACYEVNYKSNEMVTKIIILRVRCKTCDVTHSLKPNFLASRHQYDTLERQKYIFQYTDNSKNKVSLRKLSDKLFPALLVSHTVMYYWVRSVSTKKESVEPLIVKEIQEYLPSADICSQLLPEAEAIPPGTRNKPYSKDTVKLINWGRIYIRVTSSFRSIMVTDYDTKPLIYINNIMDLLWSHVFL